MNIQKMFIKKAHLEIPTMESEKNICENCLTQLQKIERLNLIDEKKLKILENPKKIVSVNFPVQMDNGEIKYFNGYRVQYNNALGPFKGGIRFHQDVDLAEVSELAFLMSLKTSLVEIPLGGGKGGVTFNPKEHSKGEIERISRAYIKEMFSILGPLQDIPAPDVNTNPQIMSYFRDEYEKIAQEHSPGSFTGKPLHLNGSLVRGVSTSLGGFYILDKMFEGKDVSNVKIVIEGFGNAGSNFAKFAQERGFKIVGVSDSSSGVYDENGLNVDELISFKENRNRLIDYENAQKVSLSELLELETDILVPAALGGSITENNVEHIKANIILELANSPINPVADEVLYQKGVTIIPDILANSGGVIVSYFEWVQNLQNYYWNEEKIKNELKDKVLNAYVEVEKISKEHTISFRQASYLKAISRIVEAQSIRGVN